MGTLGYDISSGATKYQPPLKFLDLPLVPDDTLGLEFGLDLPDLGFDLTVSQGFDLGSSSMPNNDDSDWGLLPLFPTSYASHSNSIETTNNGFDSTLKGFHGDGYDLSLLPHAYPMGSQDYQPPTVHISLPSSEGLDLPALAFGSTVSEAFDLGSCSMPHNDDSDLCLLPPFPTSYDLSLLPHAYPMGSQDYQPPTVHITLPSSEGLDLPALAFGSTVSEGFDLGSCSMPHNDDSDLCLLPPFPTSYDLSLLPHAYPMGSQDYQPPTVHITLPSSEGLDLPALAFGSTTYEDQHQIRIWAGFYRRPVLESHCAALELTDLINRLVRFGSGASALIWGGFSSPTVLPSTTSSDPSSSPTAALKHELADRPMERRIACFAV
ncbi:disease resistance protein RPV1-like isoform X10 [Fagus crenata]